MQTLGMRCGIYHLFDKMIMEQIIRKLKDKIIVVARGCHAWFPQIRRALVMATRIFHADKAWCSLCLMKLILSTVLSH